MKSIVWRVDHSHMKLGAKAPVFDKRTLQLGRYLASNQLPAPPASVDFESRVPSWGVMLNDRIGDCGVAGYGHAVLQQSTYSGKPYMPTDAGVLGAYSAISGYDPVTGRNDNGVVLLEALKYFRSQGVDGHKLSAFAAVHPTDLRETMQAVTLFGGLYVGLALPACAQYQDVWDVPWYGPLWYGRPGSWGGHCVYVVGYGSGGLTCVTWGSLKRLTWSFWRSYCVEAYALLSPDWFNGRNVAPNGLDLNTLTRDLSLI